MQVSVEATGGLERRMKVQIPEDRIASEVQSRLQNMARTARLPGFRPGKVPFKVVAKRFGPQVRDEVLGEVVRSSFYDAVVQEKLKPAGNPTIEPADSQAGAGFTYTATFEVYPEVPVPSVESLKVTRPVAEVTEPDVEKMLETLRKQRKTWQDVERPAAQGDRVVIDFTGLVDGEALEKAKGAEVPVEIGSGRMLPGFEEGLVGAKGGDELSLDLVFPEDYHGKDVAGKPVTFQVKVRSVAEGVLPEIDEAFAASFGHKEGGVEEFRAEVRSNMQRELDDALRARTKQAVMDELLAANPLELPEALVREEQERLFAQRRGELARQGIDALQLGLTADALADQARRRVALGLLLAELVQAQGIKAAPEEVRARVESIAAAYEEPAQVVNWYYGERARLGEIESAVLEDKLVQWVLAHAQVTDQPTSFDELLNPGQTSSQSA